MKKIVWSLLSVLLIVSNLFGQKNINVSQYMLSRYSINTAFGGSHEALSILGSYRQKWIGFNKAPVSQFVSAHAPLKNESIALGMEFFSQSYAVTHQSGFAASYTYRIKPSLNSWLALSLSGGIAFSTGNWAEVLVRDPGDRSFEINEKRNSPVVGFATAWYGKSFFAGVSVPNFIYNDISSTKDAEFNPSKSQYLVTGGYLFSVSEDLKLEPSSLLILNENSGTIYDLSGSAIWRDMLWFGFTYRSTKEYVGMAAFQIMPQLRLAYSFDYTTGQLQTYNNGTHEISLQFDFGYKIKTPNPTFF